MSVDLSVVPDLCPRCGTILTFSTVNVERDEVLAWCSECDYERAYVGDGGPPFAA